MAGKNLIKGTPTSKRKTKQYALNRRKSQFAQRDRSDSSRYAPENVENLYNSQYLHSSLFTFQNTVNRKKLSTVITTFEDIFDRQIKIQKTEFTKFCNALGEDEQKVINFLKQGRAQNAKSTEGAFDSIVTELKDNLSNINNSQAMSGIDKEKTLEKNLYDLVKIATDEYIKTSPQQFQNLIKATKVTETEFGNELTMLFNQKTGKYEGESSLRGFKSFIIPSLAGSLGMKSDELSALFVGTANTLDLLGLAIKTQNMVDKRSNVKTFVQSVGDGMFEGSILSKNYSNLSMNEQIRKNIAGKIGERVSAQELQALSQVKESLTIKKTSTKKVQDITVVADAVIEIPDINGEIKQFGVSVKNLSKQFNIGKSGSPNDLMVSMRLNTTTGVNEILKKIKSVGIEDDRVDILPYIITNFVVLTEVGSINRKTKKFDRVRQQDLPGIKDFILSCVYNYIGVFMGTYFDRPENSLTEEEKVLMSAGMIYDGINDIIIPIYQLLNKIFEGLKKNENKISAMISFDISNFGRSDALSLHTEKLKTIKNIGEKGRNNIYTYPQELVSVGSAGGIRAGEGIQMKTTLRVLKNLLQQSGWSN